LNILFIDESEKQKDIGDKNNLFFSLTGLIISSDDLFYLNNSISDIILNYSLSNLKDSRDLKFSKGNKFKLSNDISWLLKEKNVIVISVILTHPEQFSKDRLERNYLSAIKFIIERYFLRIKKNKEVGIVIHDSLSSPILEKKINKQFYNLSTTDGVVFSRFSKPSVKFSSKVYPNLFFANDNYCNLLQLSDLISSSVNKAYFEFRKEADIGNPKYPINEIYKYNSVLEIYWPYFDKNQKGIIDGWGLKIW